MAALHNYTVYKGPELKRGGFSLLDPVILVSQSATRYIDRVHCPVSYLEVRRPTAERLLSLYNMRDSHMSGLNNTEVCDQFIKWQVQHQSNRDALARFAATNLLTSCQAPFGKLAEDALITWFPNRSKEVAPFRRANEGSFNRELYVEEVKGCLRRARATAPKAARTRTVSNTKKVKGVPQPLNQVCGPECSVLLIAALLLLFPLFMKTVVSGRFRPRFCRVQHS